MIAKVIPLDLRLALTVPLVTAGDSRQIRLNAANHVRQKKTGGTTIVSAGAEYQLAPAFDHSTGQVRKRKGEAQTRRKATTVTAASAAEPPHFAPASAEAASGAHVVAAASPAVQLPRPFHFNSAAPPGPIFQPPQPLQFHAYSQANPYQAGAFTALPPHQYQPFQSPAHPHPPVSMGIPLPYPYYPSGVQFSQFRPPGPVQQHVGSSGNLLFNDNRRRDSTGG
jgi:hypothetical protein